jgi:AraC-like DNA-binding protein
VRQALQDMEQYLRRTHISHVYWTLLRRGEFDAFEVSAELPTTITSGQARMVFELAVAQCYRVTRSVSGDRLRIAKVCLRHGDDQSLLPLRRFFNAPVEVNADFDGLLFAPGAIDLKVAQANTQAHESLRRLILAQQSALSEDSLPEQVKLLIRPLLPTAQCTIERIARCFSYDKRTLQRYLREDSDTSYQQLVDEVRFETACFYLKEASMPITQVAQLAGFSESTNFSRAFRRRFGVSPRQWRQTHGEERPPRGIRSSNQRH